MEVQHVVSAHSGHRLHYMQREIMELNMELNMELLSSLMMFRHAHYQIQAYCLPDALTISPRLFMSRTSTRRADGTRFTLLVLSQKCATEIRGSSGSGDANSDCFSNCCAKVS